jgi:hypothetical protein
MSGVATPLISKANAYQAARCGRRKRALGTKSPMALPRSPISAGASICCRMLSPTGAECGRVSARTDALRIVLAPQDEDIIYGFILAIML